MPISVPNFNYIARLVSEIMRGSQNLMWGLLTNVRRNLYVCSKYLASSNSLPNFSVVVLSIVQLCEYVFAIGFPLYTHSLTHSLVSLPRWGLATADDHSDIFLLHCARSCDIFFSWMHSQPVHSSMSCIHCLLGLPWCRNPSMIPSRTVSANFPALHSMYPSIFNSFPVIRTASAKKSPFSRTEAHILFSLETPLRLSGNMLHGWKDNSMLAKRLAACTYLSSIVSELYDA